MKNTQDILTSASAHLFRLSGHIFDLLTISKPVSPGAAINLTKVISKLSPFVGNLIEFNTVEFLNRQVEYQGLGKWKRQDPGFPDTIFDSSIKPTPGFEIKAWFPLATEITARFKDSQNHFLYDQTNVCLLAWLPDQLIFGKPQIIDVCIVSGKSVAKARDNHYHDPPDYLVLEPEDTTQRTQNLQQTNTNGYKWQGTSEEFNEALQVVKSWDIRGNYDLSTKYQNQVRELFSQYSYRLDTNFAKIDRIYHTEIEEFKDNVLNTNRNGLSIRQWAKLLGKHDDAELYHALEKNLGIREVTSENFLL